MSNKNIYHNSLRKKTIELKLTQESWNNFFRVMNNRKNTIKLIDGSSLGNFWACIQFLQQQFEEKSKCYHQWRWYNFWCQECGEFTNDKNHGVMVHQCFKCGILWDKEDAFWTLEEINNLFFNMTYRTRG